MLISSSFIDGNQKMQYKTEISSIICISILEYKHNAIN